MPEARCALRDGAPAVGMQQGLGVTPVVPPLQTAAPDHRSGRFLVGLWCALVVLVDGTRLELVTSALRTRRSPS